MPPKSRVALVSTILILGLTLAACGKKPAHVDSPSDMEDHFPLVYPDAATDPKPDAPPAPPHAP